MKHFLKGNSRNGSALSLLGLLIIYSHAAKAGESVTIPGKFLNYEAAKQAVWQAPKDSSDGGGICCSHHETGFRKAWKSGKLDGVSIEYYASFYYPEKESCPAGTEQYSNGSCLPIPSTAPPEACSVGNPIAVSTGIKRQVETDYQDSKSGLLSFVRTYSSDTGKWRDNLSRSTTDKKVLRTDGSVLVRPWIKSNLSDGTSTYYLATGNAKKIEYISIKPSTGGITPTTTKNTSGITLDENGVRYTYNSDGKLTRAERLATGAYAEYSYEDTNTIVTDNLGRTLRMSKDASGNVTQMITPAGVTFNYTYIDGNLTRLDNSADISKQYHYEDSRFPHALTGITDEKGVRFATWKYDDQGRAVLSEHADGAERVTLSFNSDGSTTVTNELGKQTTYHFTHLYGTNKPTSVEGHASENCIAANSSYTYDQYGYKDLVTDWKGNITDFDYSPTGLEIKRVEAKGTSDERITVTEWNPTLRQPIKITEPDRITEFVYDDNGKLKSKSILPVEIQ
ncbi:hypothetical protein [Hahella sp. HN01]|uniref:hypothetical protein n=1 Tax=Hahella sp. HN01 TaxID=2847262 RepID=UPI0020A6CF86|nr:hypothetical protein [Hahella sp. HN01]